MLDFFSPELGYPALFFLSFLAATILPLGSEWLLIAMVAGSFDPSSSVLIATAGNTLGACTTYFIGIWGGTYLIERVLRIDETSQKKAHHFYSKWGQWSLLLSWLPVIGDPLCLVGGIARVRFSFFFLLVLVGKFSRYAALTWLTLQAV
ncbi:YqaA family protein [Halodesulfovibrio marinisediminis]|uniref:Membrane protein YqaA, SNARE-associated domain n=1 Tax=Halodesulfovibrio marinisediminis DSM 17456 TaxID=1121457 RepID=A0A1N6EXD5_9BACT|nr:YqaA family protein [Halodesulfovibrio marinisediminis]SIN87670.1 membrane protein YqaA, SNARE-associated domain [Halodesulfovibrio marinisediminis DSM 17456]